MSDRAAGCLAGTTAEPRTDAVADRVVDRAADRGSDSEVDVLIARRSPRASEHISVDVKAWFADAADRLTTAADLVDFVLRAGDIPSGPYVGKLAAIAAELGREGCGARALSSGDVAPLLARLDLARRGLLACLHFRCSGNPDALEDLGVVADELATLCQEGMALHARIAETETRWTRWRGRVRP